MNFWYIGIGLGIVFIALVVVIAWLIVANINLDRGLEDIKRKNRALSELNNQHLSTIRFKNKTIGDLQTQLAENPEQGGQWS